MKFSRIYVEEDVRTDARTLAIIDKFSNVPVYHIRKVEDVFGRVKKPYLQKRTNLNLFIGRKEGQLVKEAPDAYGYGDEPHYYYIHAYNCIYECEYCYLQGYFQSPDLVLFVNHPDIIAEMTRVVAMHSDQNRVWFHGGEFSDSLAMAHITNELEDYVNFLHNEPHAWIELRTKSVNVRPILNFDPPDNLVVSYSLSTKSAASLYDHNTPGLGARIKAMAQLAEKGFRLGLHLDPIIYGPDLGGDYAELIEMMLAAVPVESLEYVSIGVVRFTRDVHRAMVKNYPDSNLLAGDFVKSYDDKVRYPRPMRLHLLDKVKQACSAAGIPEEKVYLCMEQQDV